jgi:hypothetical protein
MAISANEVFAATMSQEMIEASDKRTIEILAQEANDNSWKFIRSTLPDDVQARLDAVRTLRTEPQDEPHDGA